MLNLKIKKKFLILINYQNILKYLDALGHVTHSTHNMVKDLSMYTHQDTHITLGVEVLLVGTGADLHRALRVLEHPLTPTRSMHNYIENMTKSINVIRKHPANKIFDGCFGKGWVLRAC